MNATEWLELSAVIRDRWPHADLPEGTIAQWGRDLADLPAVQVAAALEAFYREGREFPPNGGQLRAKVVELAIGAPDWGYVLSTLRRLLAAPPSYVYSDPDHADADERGLVRVLPRDEGLAVAHPLVRSFVTALGWDQVAAGVSGGNDEARLREKWNALLDRARRERLLDGVPPGGLRELERIAGQTAPRKLRAREAVGELEAAN